MRYETAALLALAVLAAAGCTPMQWVKPDASAGQLEQDSVQCQQDAWREARLRGWYYPPMVPYAARDRLGGPFVAWPYGPYGDPFGDPFLEEGRLAQFCMRNKGYELVPAEPKK